MKPTCTLVAFSAIFLLGSCMSTTTLYRDGQKIAKFQGDMTGVDYSDGSTSFKAATVDHSSATKAGGEAAQNRIQSAGAAVAASGLTLLLK